MPGATSSILVPLVPGLDLLFFPWDVLSIPLRILCCARARARARVHARARATCGQGLRKNGEVLRGEAGRRFANLMWPPGLV